MRGAEPSEEAIQIRRMGDKLLALFGDFGPDHNRDRYQNPEHQQIRQGESGSPMSLMESIADPVNERVEQVGEKHRHDEKEQGSPYRVDRPEQKQRQGDGPGDAGGPAVNTGDASGSGGGRWGGLIHGG